MSVPRLAVLCDMREENWPSMDLVGEMLLTQLQQRHTSSIDATAICPPLHHRLTRVPFLSNGFAFNADRLVNRFGDYPRLVRKLNQAYDLFHIVDHSYSQLVHQLPACRTVVTCHDLDTFRCLLPGNGGETRSSAFRLMMKRTLKGLRKAALVTCVSEATRDQLLEHNLVLPERVIVIPNGVHPSCVPEQNPVADAQAKRLIKGATGKCLNLLHVGSSIPRKRLDILLRVFAALRREFPQAQLIRVGGNFTPEHERLIEEEKLSNSIIVLPHLERDVLAAVYRLATLVLQPSEREGFGLPVIEAMACGTVVVASDLPVFREVGGDAAVYCPLADVKMWSETIIKLLYEQSEQPEQWTKRREKALAQAAKFSWVEYAEKMVSLYRQLLEAN